MLALDHVQLAAPPGCEAEARRFFGELLGLEEIEKPAAMRASGGVWFRLGDGRELHIGVERNFTPARKAHPALRVRREGGPRSGVPPSDGEIGELAERLEAAGAPVAWDERYTGVRRFFTADPWGNRIELLG